MSTSVDNRVVSMRFDNKQFESGTKQTMSTLDKLKAKLNLPGASKGLEDVGAASKRVSFDGISRGVEAVQVKFSALQVVAVTALTNITNSAVNAGKELVKSLTIAPIKDGYEDYNRKLTSVQTITNATGKSIKEVDGYFRELDIYADRTIYNLDDMTSSFAKFTNAGVDLDKSVPAIKGIANMVALAGQDAGAAQIAMYNLSQSIAGGFLTRMDFKSLELANVATKEWKDQMIQGAIAAGTLTKTSEGMFLVKGAKEAVSSTALFVDELSKGWASTEVMLSVLGQYGDDTTDIGAKAQAAAQEIKSFSMMMDTLKAAAGTGWTDTFEILVGNLEEAKALFTPLSETIGGFLDSMSKARNDLLGDWKDLGGRTVLIEAFVNSFKVLMSIIKPIKEAFRDIFPAMTGKRLFEITTALRDFTAKLSISDTTATNIKKSFKGLFAVLDIGKQWLMALGKAIFEIITYLVPAGDGFLSCASSMGDFFVWLNKIIKSSNIFTTVLDKVVNAIKVVIDGIGLAIQFIIGLFKGFDNVDLSGVTAMSDHMKKCFEPVTELGEKVQTVFSIVKGYISDTIIPVFMKLGDSVKDAFSVIVSGISTAFDGNGSVMEILNGGLFVAILLGLRTLVKSIKSIFDGPSSILENVSNILGGVQDSLETFQNTLKAGVLTKIAIAIAILAGSVLLLSLINPERLASSMAAITGLFIELFGSMAVFQKIMGDRGLKSMNKLAISMILLGVAINVLVIAMGKLAKLDWNGIAKGLVGIGGLITIMAVSSKTISAGSTDLIKGSIGLIAFGIAMNLLAIALKKISSMSFDSILTGLATIALIIGEVALFSKVTGNNKNLISTSVGISVLAVAMIIFAKAIEKLGSLPTDQIVRGLAAMAGVLLIVAGALRVIPKDMGLKALGLIAIGVALNILSLALTSMGNMSWDQIAKGLIVLAGALAIITIALQFFKKGVTGAAAILIVAVALAVLAPVLERLGSMSWEQIAKGLIVLVGVFTILGVAGFALKAVAPVIFLLAASIALLGVACLAVGVGMAAFAAGLASLAAIGVAGGVVLVAIIAQLIGLIPTIAVAIGKGIVQFAMVIGEGAYDIGKAVVSVMISIMNSIVTVAPQIFTCIQTVLTSWLSLLVDMVPLMVESGMELILGILQGVAANIEDVVAAGIDVILNFISGVSSKIPDIIDTAFEVIISFINGLADAIRNNRTDIENACKNLIDAIVESITGLMSSMNNVGKNIIEGMIDGIKSMGGTLVKAAKGVVSDSVDGIKKLLGIHSPSRVFAEIGRYSSLGMAGGLEDYAGKVSTAATDVGVGAVDSLKNAMSNISDVVNGDIDMTPTIRPVLDLSDVTAGAGTINSMFGRTQGISVVNSTDKTSTINANMKAKEIQNGIDIKSNNTNQDQPIYVMVNVDNNMNGRQLTDTLTTKVTKAITRGQNSKNLAKGVS